MTTIIGLSKDGNEHKIIYVWPPFRHAFVHHRSSSITDSCFMYYEFARLIVGEVKCHDKIVDFTLRSYAGSSKHKSAPVLLRGFCQDIELPFEISPKIHEVSAGIVQAMFQGFQKGQAFNDRFLPYGVRGLQQVRWENLSLKTPKEQDGNCEARILGGITITKDELPISGGSILRYNLCAINPPRKDIAYQLFMDPSNSKFVECFPDLNRDDRQEHFERAVVTAFHVFSSAQHYVDGPERNTPGHQDIERVMYGKYLEATQAIPDNLVDRIARQILPSSLDNATQVLQQQILNSPNLLSSEGSAIVAAQDLQRLCGDAEAEKLVTTTTSSSLPSSSTSHVASIADITCHGTLDPLATELNNLENEMPERSSTEIVIGNDSIVQSTEQPPSSIPIEPAREVTDIIDNRSAINEKQPSNIESVDSPTELPKRKKPKKKKTKTMFENVSQAMEDFSELRSSESEYPKVDKATQTDTSRTEVAATSPLPDKLPDDDVTPKASPSKAASAELVRLSSTESASGSATTSSSTSSIQFKFDGFHPALRCQNPECRRMTSCWDSSVKICPACGPRSLVRYCTRDCLYADIQNHHKNVCCRLTIDAPIDETTIRPEQLPLRPFIYPEMTDNTVERHRQAVHLAMEPDGDYFIFDDIEEHPGGLGSFPTMDEFGAVRGKGNLIFKIDMGGESGETGPNSRKERFRMLVEACLRLGAKVTPEFQQNGVHAFAMMRQELIEHKQWDAAMSIYLCMQVGFEWGFMVPPAMQDFFPGITPRGYMGYVQN